MKTPITVKDKDNVEYKLAIMSPTAQQQLQARLTHAKAYKEALDADAMMREELDKILRRRNLWDDEKQAEADKCKKTILDGELKIRKGGMKLKEAKELAFKIKDARSQYQVLFMERNAMESETADAFADQARFNFLVAVLTVYDDKDKPNFGKPYFTKDGEHPSVDDYMERSTQQHIFDIALKVNDVLNPDSSFDPKKLPENEFLLKYGFVDKDLHLIDHKGRKIDRKGRLVNDEGFFVDENNNRVDGDGHPIDEQGNYIVEALPFLDDETGDPITPDKDDPSPANSSPLVVKGSDSYHANIVECVENSESPATPGEDWSASPTVNEPTKSAK